MMPTNHPTHLRDIEALGKISRLYDDYMDSLSVACEKFCAECCTTAMTLTSLEGRFINHFLDRQNKTALYRHIQEHIRTPRYQPAMTTNGYAQICLENKTPPAETPPEPSLACPLLDNDLCAIYSIRPFGCRCMVSFSKCRKTGSAHIDELTLTVNTLFLQVIEHLDRSGFFGSLIDVMLCLEPDPGPMAKTCVTIPNQPVTQLMIPPEHRGKIQPLLDTLNHILSRTVQG
jgi:Fe-S-cluster containining protein